MTQKPDPSEAGARVERAKAILDENATMALAACEGGEPWAARVFFIEDEPDTGRFDMCCCIAVAGKTSAMLLPGARVAFVVGGDVPTRWIQGTGTAEPVEDDADAAAVLKRLHDKTADAEPFLARIDWRAVRIHVDRLRVTDLASQPPVTEFSFA
jgi:hypothetical protein